MTALDPARLATALEERAQRRVCTAGGYHTVWRIWGDGPPIVLLHGGHGSWTHWIRNIDALAQSHRVVIPDLPGFGDSAAIEGADIAKTAAAVVSGLDEMGLDGQYFLAGFSYGASVASYMLPLHPGRVSRLFLIGAAGLGPFDPASDMKRWRDAPDDGERLDAHRHNLARLMIFKPDRIDQLAVALQARNAESARTDPNKASLAADVVGRLREAKVPLSGIWGERDALAGRHLLYRRQLLSELDPHSDFTVIADAGHWIQYEEADEVNRIILERLRRDLDATAARSGVTASAGCG